MPSTRARIIGAGIAGLACAVELAERGVEVEVLERAAALEGAGCSWFAGGMLAPWCELETAAPLVAQLGAESLAWWSRHFAGTRAGGSLVLAHARDANELGRFSRRTERFEWLDGAGLGALEPDLAGRFQGALFFRDEAHLDPRAALSGLTRRLTALGAAIRFGIEASVAPEGHRIDAWQIDCTGLAARAVLGDLRGVKGEMLLLRLREVSLSRPIRVLHPRLPLYLVPRGGGVYMLGATMIESDDSRRITARSLLELLSAAYAVHPAFGEAEILEIGTGVRPAFPDNLPRIVRYGRTLYVNGLFRHGFLLAPALARRVAEIVLHNRSFPEVMRHEDSRERRLA
jgi:glycine oxidase